MFVSHQLSSLCCYSHAMDAILKIHAKSTLAPKFPKLKTNIANSADGRAFCQDAKAYLESLATSVLRGFPLPCDGHPFFYSIHSHHQSSASGVGYDINFTNACLDPEMVARAAVLLAPLYATIPLVGCIHMRTVLLVSA